MRTLIIIALALCISMHAQAQTPDLILNCDNDSTGLIPLPDLGIGYYFSYQGGLYPGGSNSIPIAHLSSGKKIAKGIKPLNGAGITDFANGAVIMVGIGASVAMDAFLCYKDSMDSKDWIGTNPCMQARSTFIGGKDMGDMVDVAAPYWSTLLDRLSLKGVDPKQVQIVWMLLQSDEDTTDLDSYIDTAVAQYKLILNNMLTYLPNLKEVFLSGMHYSGYTDPSHERYPYLIEPKGYWGNLAIKELIKQQIEGDAHLLFTGPSKVVPYISWGPYFWADGTNPRLSDGLTWPCDEYRDDSTGGGFHLKPEYFNKEGDMFNAFFNTNPVSTGWYTDAPKWGGCGTGAVRTENVSVSNAADLLINPVPASTTITISVPDEMMEKADLYLVSVNGEIVYFESFDASLFTEKQITVSNFPVGIYLVKLKSRDMDFTGKFIRQ